MSEFKFLPEVFDIPKSRRLKSPENARWILRNAAVRNSKHPQFEEVMAMMKEVVAGRR